MTFADMSVIVHPAININYPEYNEISTFSTISANMVAAYENDLGGPETLVLGGTSNVHIEAIYDFNVYNEHGKFKLWRSTYSNQIRVDTQIRDIVMDTIRTDTAIINIEQDTVTGATLISTPGNPISIQAGDPDSTIILGGFSISGSNDYTVFKTTQSNGFMFKDAFNVGALMTNGDVVVASNLYVNGHIMGHDVNMFKNIETDIENAVTRVGYAFHINQKNQLELIKYSRFYNDLPDVQKKVATFGMHELHYTDSNDRPDYRAFEDLTNVSFKVGKTGTHLFGTKDSPWIDTLIPIDVPLYPNAIVELGPNIVGSYTVNLNHATGYPDLSYVIGHKGTITIIERSAQPHSISFTPFFEAAFSNEGVMTTPAPDALGGYSVDELIYLVCSSDLVIASYRNILSVPGNIII